MKELSIEQKAQRYDEALKAAIDAHKDEDKHLKATLERIFHELKESEEDRIRKGLLYVIEHHPTLPTEEAEEYIAWLEAQGEQQLNGTFINADDVREEFMQEVYRILDADATNDRANQIIDAFDNLPSVVYSNQGWQTPADKVEPKFHEGEWITIKE